MNKRLALEETCYKHNRKGVIRKRRWSLFECLIQIFGIFLRITGLYKRGVKNAKKLAVREIIAEFPDLPETFHNYKILHLSDIHVDFMPGFDKILIRKIKGLSYDLCVMTGDYRKKTYGGYHQIMKPMERIIQNIKAKDGILATLGNHDTCKMVDHLEKMDITVLTNETVSIQKHKDEITVTGIDDPHYYYTPYAKATIEKSSNGFKILLAHTPEVYDIASNNGYRLYLCGHTHGGQICLPDKKPIITHLHGGKKYCRGMWRYDKMLGYTHSGCGSVGIPVRYNSPGEIAIIKLIKKGYGRKGTVKKLPL